MANLNRSNRYASTARRETRKFAVVRTLASCVVLLATVSGCQSLGIGKSTEDDYRAMTNTDNILGPMARAIQTSLQGDVASPVASPQLTKMLDQASKLFESGNYAESAKLYKRIATENKQTAFGEEAQYKLGESYYRQRLYSLAQDSYDRLLVDYPATRHVDDVSGRLFNIARGWLDVQAPKSSSGDIQLASHEEGEPVEPQKLNTDDITVKIPLLPNFHDPTRPTFDTRGRALKALKSIWMNDPTSPLADDALMMTAAHYLKQGNHIEADRYFKILREDYAQSPHLEKAFLLGSHVKLLSYQGPAYEGNTLDDARALKESTLRLFPDIKQRTELRQELKDIYEAKAQRLWFRVEYYQNKGRPRAVALACRQLIEEFPETDWAKRAQGVLSKLDKKAIGDLPGF